MRIAVVYLMFLALVALVSFTAALADEPDPLLSIAEAKPYRERWQDCAASAVERELRGARPAEAIVDAALMSCRDREAALARVLRRRIGASSARRIVEDLRAYDRLVLIRIVERLRGK